MWHSSWYRGGLGRWTLPGKIVSFLCWRCSDSQPMAIASAQFTFPDSSQHQCRLALREPDDCAFPWQLSTSVSPTHAAVTGFVRTYWRTSSATVRTGGVVPPVTCHPNPATSTSAGTVPPACLVPAIIPAPVRRDSLATCVQTWSVSPQDIYCPLSGERGEGGISRPVFSPLNTK